MAAGDDGRDEADEAAGADGATDEAAADDATDADGADEVAPPEVALDEVVGDPPDEHAAAAARTTVPEAANTARRGSVRASGVVAGSADGTDEGGFDEGTVGSSGSAAGEAGRVELVLVKITCYSFPGGGRVRNDDPSAEDLRCAPGKVGR